jgi:hypothetical protein
MTSESAAAASDTSWRGVFRWCEWLLAGWVTVIFLACFFAKLMSAMLISVFGAPFALGTIAVAGTAWAFGKTGCRRWWQMAILLVLPAAAATILFTNWPMKLSFVASNRALDRLADQVAAGQVPPLPTRAGAYTIKAIESRPVDGGLAVCLWTMPLNHQHVGFVRSPVGVKPPFNRWTHSQMNARWHHFGED